MNNGASEKGLTEHTLKDTGRTVLIRKVSPYLITEVDDSLKRPRPPKVEVKYETKTVMEENESDPDYREALREYVKKRNGLFNKIVLLRGCAVNLTDEQKQEVKDLRELTLAETGVVLAGSDEWVYITKICVGTDDDLKELVNAITRRSFPTEGAIGESTKSI